MLTHHLSQAISLLVRRTSKLAIATRLLTLHGGLLAALLGPVAGQAATTVVNTAADPAGYNYGITVATLGTTVTLRDAVNAARNTGGNQLITFDPSLAGQTINLSYADEASASGSSALVTGSNQQPTPCDLTIQGLTGNLGVTIAIAAGAGNMRIFFCSGGGTPNGQPSFTLNDVTLTGGSTLPSGWGGAVLVVDEPVTFNRCTFTGNSANFGGAIYNKFSVLTVTDCTIAGNTASQQGGGLYLDVGSQSSLVNVTVTGNYAVQSGGIHVDATPLPTLVNTLVANNHVTLNVPEIWGAVDSSSHHNLCSDPGTTPGLFNGAGNMTNGVNGNILGVEPLLGLLQNNGGPTPTVALLSGSPAINAGIAVAGVTTDQRGVARPQNGANDIGAFEVVGAPPFITSASSTIFLLGLANTFAVTASGSPSPTFTATGTMPSGVTLSASGLLSGTPTMGSGGSYLITLTASNGFLPNATQNFTLTVNEDPRLVVTTTNDVVDPNDGATSLREAFIYAAAHTDPQTITFTPSLAGQTITLTNVQDNNVFRGPSALAQPINSPNTAITIQGLTGSSGITIRGGGNLRLFYFYNGTLTLNDLTISNGQAGSSQGGAVYMYSGSLNMSRCTLTGNSAALGGALYMAGGAASLTNCSIIGNTAIGLGGGVMPDSGSTVNLVHVTLTGNSAGSGGGIYNGGAARITDTIIAANSGGNVMGSALNPASAYNLIGSGAAGGLVNGVNGNLVGVANPGLSTLANNGGPTMTLALLAGSPAINAGIAVAGVTTDQRGVARPQNGANDIGAFEVVGAPPFITSASSTIFLLGLANTFAVTASGSPSPTFTATGTMPSGVTLSASGLLSGTPSAGSGGVYPISITAHNGFPPNAAQSFTLTVIQPQSPIISTADGAYWYLGPAAVGNDWHIYRQVLGQTPVLLDGLAARIGQANDGTVLVENSNGGVYARIGSTNGLGSGWQLLTAVTAGDGATWFLGADGSGNDFYIYRWAPSGAPAYSSGAATQLSVLADGSILARNSIGDTYLRVGSNAGLGNFWQLVVIASTPSVLNSPTRLGNGAFQCSFTNQPGASFTVLASTNLALPLNNWTSLGAPIESPAGQYQFTDAQAANFTQRFYRVTSP